MVRLLLGIALPACLLAKQYEFNEILQKTLEGNKELKSKRLNVDVAKEQLKAAKAMDFGKLSFAENYLSTNNAMYVFASKLGSRKATFRDFGFAEFLAGMGGLPNNANQLLDTAPKDLDKPQSIENYDTALVYELPIFTGFKIAHAKEMAALQVKANEIKLKRDEKLLAKETLSAYNGAVAAKYYIEAAKKGKETTESFVKLAKSFLEAGMVVKSDVLQAESYDAQVNAKMIEAKNAYMLALAYLRFLSSEESVTDVGGFANVGVELKEPLSALKEGALTKREDYKWMEYNVKTMQSKVGFDSAEKYPMVGLQAKYGFSDKKPTLSDDRSYYMVGVGLNYTIFDGGKISADSQKSKIELMQTQNYYEYMRDGIKLEVEKNYLTFEAKKAVITEKTKSKEFSEEVVSHTTEMYKNGLAPMANLLLKEAEAAKARAELIGAKYEEAMAAAELRLSLGMNFGQKDGE